MTLSTFNFWYIVTPVTMVIAVVLAFASISEGSGKVKKLVPDRVWAYGMTCYCVVIWVLLSKLFIAESLLGMIEALGGDAPDAADRARSTFWIVAAIWAGIIYACAFFVRKYYAKYVDYACKHGRSRADRIRRKRGEKKRREDEKELEKRRKLAENGKLYLVDFSKGGTSVKRVAKKKVVKATPAPKNIEQEPTIEQTIPTAEQTTPTIEQQVEAEFEKYRIEKRTNLECVYTDEGGNKYFITEYLPEGVVEYFVAIRLDREVIPLFLGWENAEDNLRRYLTMELEESDCSKHAAV